MVSDSDSRTVTVFTDEVRPTGDDRDWLYIGSLFIEPRFHDQVTNAILNARYAAGDWAQADDTPQWRDTDHDGRDAPVTFTDCTREPVYDAADRWLSLLGNRTDTTRRLHVKLTGVNVAALPVDTADMDATTYEHLYREILRGHLMEARSQFFGDSVDVTYDTIHVADHTPARNDGFRSVLDTLSDPVTRFGPARFHARDHHSHEHGSDPWTTAHLLQLANTVTGATAALFTDDTLPHKQASLAWQLKPLVEQSMECHEPTLERFTLAFYPAPDAADGQQQFYHRRDIKQDTDPHKHSLERFL